MATSTPAWPGPGQQGAEAARLGITGFCWGGRITWLYAAHNPALKAGVAWYGRLVGDVSPVNPKRAIDLVGSLKAPVLGLYGGAGHRHPAGSVDRMKEALADGSPAARRSSSWSTPTRRMPSMPTTGPATARQRPRTAGRCLDWFKAHGVA